MLSTMKYYEAAEEWTDSTSERSLEMSMATIIKSSALLPARTVLISAAKGSQQGDASSSEA
jgi:hypothetical protein